MCLLKECNNEARQASCENEFHNGINVYKLLLHATPSGNMEFPLQGGPPDSFFAII